MRHRPRAAGVLQARRHQQARLRVARRLVPDRDIRPLGHGAFSSAFALRSGLVLKVTDVRDRTALWFHAWIRRHPNIHWPRIRKVIRTPRHTIFWMERLWPVIANQPKRFLDTFRVARGARVVQAEGAADLLSLCRRLTLDTLLEADPFAEDDWQACPPRLRRPILDCFAAAEAAGFREDGKRQAYMWRKGGVLVVADPFVDGELR